MTYTRELVIRDLVLLGIDAAGTETEQRERLASLFEKQHQDYLAAWEARTGRPWKAMTPDEAKDLGDKWPELHRNPGFLSRYYAPR